MGERRATWREQYDARLAEQARREQFEDCAAGRERLMRMRRERSLLFVYPDEWTTPSAAEAASWED